MSKVRIAWRLCLGGAICGSFPGSFAGGLLGVAFGILCGDVGCGLDGALLGGCVGCLGGALYGIALALWADPTGEERRTWSEVAQRQLRSDCSVGVGGEVWGEQRTGRLE